MTNTTLKDIPITLELRSCGTCTACCVVAEVKNEDESFNKPAWSKCQHACPSTGGSCAIFNDPKRPKVCGSFQCSWLRGYGEQDDRPDKSGMMVSINEFNGGKWIVAVEVAPDTLFTAGKGIVMSVAVQTNLPVIVSKYSSRPPYDKGDLTVIKTSLLPRTDRMRGELVGFLDEEKIYGVYELKME